MKYYGNKMRNLILVIGIALMVSCAPGKSETITYVDIYCDSCKIRITNEWYEKETKTKAIETPFEGIVVGYKRVEFYRFDSPNSCVRPGVFEYYTGSFETTWTYIIENSDTTQSIQGGGAGFCY